MPNSPQDAGLASNLQIEAMPNFNLPRNSDTFTIFVLRYEATVRVNTNKSSINIWDADAQNAILLGVYIYVRNKLSLAAENDHHLAFHISQQKTKRAWRNLLFNSK
jgi:hypothetical protein